MSAISQAFDLYEKSEVGTEWAKSSLREGRPKERENDLRPRNEGQQLETENPFISRGFAET